jgi:uncharacterized membrane protein
VLSSIEVPEAPRRRREASTIWDRSSEASCDSSGTHAFLFNNGRFSTIDVPGSTWTIATGINNIGQIIGGYGRAVKPAITVSC